MAAILAAAALACGSAMAADSSTEHGQRVSNEHPAKASGNGVVDKTKRAFSRMGDKIRNTGERLGQKLGTDKDSRHDTRAMGASGSGEAQDQGRRQRMDDAYANWRDRQQQERR